MESVKNLYGVKATLLPPKVMVLLSKYAQAVKNADDVVIQLSSLNVFKHVHNSYARSSSPFVKKAYLLLLMEVNKQLMNGNMVVFSDSNSDSKSNKLPRIEMDERYKPYENHKISNSRSEMSVSLLRHN